MKVVVGLGNPGSEYAHTRHNLGYRVVDLLAERLKGTWSEGAWYFFCRIAKGSGALLLVKPVTFMNRSGVAVADVQDRFDVDIGDVLVVADDVHLDLGRDPAAAPGQRRGPQWPGIDYRPASGSAAFPRLRVGIGAPPDGADRVEYVLSRFEDDEWDAVDAGVREAAGGVECWMECGIDEAMNRYNS